MLIAVVAVYPVAAVHSVPPIKSWWDLDDDRIVDDADSNIGYQRLGPLWTVEKITSFSATTATWRGWTNWDPFNSTESGGVHRAEIRVDGAQM